MYLSYIILLALIGYAIAFTYFFKLKIERTWFMVVPLIILICYLGGLIGVLQQTANILFILGLGALILSPLYLRQELKTQGILTSKYITPGFVFSLFFIVILQLIAMSFHYSMWDEFSHWGQHTRYMFMQNHLLTATDITGHPDYPPGGALFQYFYGRVTGFSEGVSYAAQSLLLYSPLALLTTDIKWKNWGNALLISSLGILVLMALNVRLVMGVNIYMDSPIGIYFGICIASYLSSSKTPRAILSLLPAICALMLFKIKLMPFAFFIVGMIMIYHIFTRNKHSHREKFITPTLCAALLLISAYLTQLSWIIYLKYMKIYFEYAVNISIDKINPTVIKSFIHALLGNPIEYVLNTNWHQTNLNTIIQLLQAIRNSPLLNLCIFLVLILWFSRQIKDSISRKSLYITHSCLFIGFLAYTVGLLFIYLFAYNGYNSSHIVSFYRFIGIYFIGWGLVIFYDFSCLIKQHTIRTKLPKYACAALFICLTSTFIFKNYFLLKRPVHIAHSIWFLRQNIKKVTDKVNAVVPPSQSVFVVWQRSNGFQDAILSYELIPRKFSGASLGKPYEKIDIWTSNLSANAFVKELKNYDYLLLAYTDNQFWQTYGPLLKQYHASIKPFATYTACTSKEFYNGSFAPNCKLTAETAYLFKIEKHHGNITQFIPLSPILSHGSKLPASPRQSPL